MGRSAETGVHVVAGASIWRAAASVLLPVFVPVAMAAALARSGHSLADYPNLIASGDLSLFTQAMSWAALVAWVWTFAPAAIAALSSQFFLAIADGSLITASGERFRLEKIESISVRRTFFFPIVRIRSAGAEKSLNAAFAREDVPGLRSALKADPKLNGIPVD